VGRLHLKCVDTFHDRTGRLRHYFRRGKGPRIALPGLPGSAEFMAAYQAALDDEKRSPQRPRGAPGTFDALASLYYNSVEFARTRSLTQANYRSVIDNLIQSEGIGHRRVDQLRREHVSKMIAKRSATPSAANHVLKKLRMLMEFAGSPTDGAKTTLQPV
jgi:hypothetical protein